MDDKWPYFDVEYSGAHFFTSVEEVEQELRAGYVVSDDTDEETLGNGIGSPSKKFKGKHKNTIEQHLKALRDYPDEYLLLYNMQYSINHFTLERPAEGENAEKFQPARAMIFIDNENDNIKVDVEMFEPVGADLVIDEGKANFDTKDFSVAKAKAIIDLLQRHKMVDNLDDLKLRDADEECQNIVKQAVEELKKEKNRPSKGVMSEESEDSTDNSSVDDEAFSKFSTSNEGDTGQSTETPPQTEEKHGIRGWWERRKARRSLSTEDREQILKANRTFENWLNKNKVKGRSWRLGYDGDGGWTTFTSYPTEYRRFPRHDVESNDKGEIKYNYEFKIYTRIVNGKVQIAYSLPPGKILNNDQAALIAAAFKAAGVKYVSFNGMTDANEAAMRTGCAFKGLIPTNHTINFEKFDKMIDSAGTKMDKNSPEFYRYKYDLAMQVNKNLQKKGIDYNDEKNKSNPDCLRIRWAIGSYELYPFSHLWTHSGLRDSYEKKVWMTNLSSGERKNSGAAYMIGAKMAAFSLYKVFSKNSSSPVSVLLNGNSSLTEDERLALASALRQNNVSSDTNVHDLPPKTLLALYDAMFKTQTEQAKKDLEESYFKAIVSSNEFNSKDNPEQYAIKECNENANTLIRNMNEELADSMLPKIFLTETVKPTYNFKEAHERAVELGIIRPRKNKNRGDNERNDNAENESNNSRRKTALPYSHRGRGGME